MGSGFEIVAILEHHLLINFRLEHVEPQPGSHVVPHKCKGQLISGVKPLQLIEHQTRE